MFSRINIPSKCYTDSKWIDTDLVRAIKSCIADHPDWEFVIITSRADIDHFVYDRISKSQLKKLKQIRSANKQMVQEVLPITEFYFDKCNDLYALKDFSRLQHILEEIESNHGASI